MNRMVIPRHQLVRGEAIPYHRKAIELDPNYAQAHYNLGMALERQNKQCEAIACSRRAVELNPNIDPLAFSMVVESLLKEGKPDEVLAFCKKATVVDPTSTDAHLTLGNTQFKLGRLDEAIASYKKVIE